MSNQPSQGDTTYTRSNCFINNFLSNLACCCHCPFPHPVDMLIVADCSTTLCHIQLPTSRPTLFVWTGGSHITTVECGCHSHSVYLFKLEYSGDCLKKPPSHTPPIHTKDGNVSGDKNYWQTMASHIPKSIYPHKCDEWNMEAGFCMEKNGLVDQKLIRYCSFDLNAQVD